MAGPASGDDLELGVFLSKAYAAKTEMAALRDELSHLHSVHEASNNTVVGSCKGHTRPPPRVRAVAPHVSRLYGLPYSAPRVRLCDLTATCRPSDGRSIACGWTTLCQRHRQC